MSLISQKFYNLKCDRCGVYLLDDIWRDEFTVEDEAGMADWVTMNNKHYCPDCYDYDEDNDKFVIKPPIDEQM